MFGFSQYIFGKNVAIKWCTNDAQPIIHTVLKEKKKNYSFLKSKKIGLQ